MEVPTPVVSESSHFGVADVEAEKAVADNLTSETNNSAEVAHREREDNCLNTSKHGENKASRVVTDSSVDSKKQSMKNDLLSANAATDQNSTSTAQPRQNGSARSTVFSSKAAPFVPATQRQTSNVPSSQSTVVNASMAGIGSQSMFGSLVPPVLAADGNLLNCYPITTNGIYCAPQPFLPVSLPTTILCPAGALPLLPASSNGYFDPMLANYPHVVPNFFNSLNGTNIDVSAPAAPNFEPKFKQSSSSRQNHSTFGSRAHSGQQRRPNATHSDQRSQPDWQAGFAYTPLVDENLVPPVIGWQPPLVPMPIDMLPVGLNPPPEVSSWPLAQDQTQQSVPQNPQRPRNRPQPRVPPRHAQVAKENKPDSSKPPTTNQAQSSQNSERQANRPAPNSSTAVARSVLRVDQRTGHVMKFRDVDDLRKDTGYTRNESDFPALPTAGTSTATQPNPARSDVTSINEVEVKNPWAARSRKVAESSHEGVKKVKEPTDNMQSTGGSSAAQNRPDASDKPLLSKQTMPSATTTAPLKQEGLNRGQKAESGSTRPQTRAQQQTQSRPQPQSQLKSRQQSQLDSQTQPVQEVVEQKGAAQSQAPDPPSVHSYAAALKRPPAPPPPPAARPGPLQLNEHSGPDAHAQDASSDVPTSKSHGQTTRDEAEQHVRFSDTNSNANAMATNQRGGQRSGRKTAEPKQSARGSSWQSADAESAKKSPDIGNFSFSEDDFPTIALQSAPTTSQSPVTSTSWPAQDTSTGKQSVWATPDNNGAKNSIPKAAVKETTVIKSEGPSSKDKKGIANGESSASRPQGKVNVATKTLNSASAKTPIDATAKQTAPDNGLMLKNKKKKFKASGGIQLDLASAIEQAAVRRVKNESEHESSHAQGPSTARQMRTRPRQAYRLQKTVMNSVDKPSVKAAVSAVTVTVSAAASASAAVVNKAHHPNVLDSSAPVRLRGKERELPKRKKPSLLKRSIILERIANRKRLAEKRAGLAQDAAETPQSQPQAPETAKAVAESNKVAPEDPIRLAALKRIHTNRFRDYCDQLISRKFNRLCFSVISTLAYYQRRHLQKDAVKARMRKRIVCGLHECTKYVRAGSRNCRALIIAPNLEDTPSLNAVVRELIATCVKNEIRVLFALNRLTLGYAVHRDAPVACIAILSVSGAEQTSADLFNLVDQARIGYQERLESEMRSVLLADDPSAPAASKVVKVPAKEKTTSASDISIADRNKASYSISRLGENGQHGLDGASCDVDEYEPI